MRLVYPSSTPPGPSGPDADLDALYGAARSARADRPWLGVCMIASLDGSTAIDGLSGGLGNDGDRQVFAALRRAADVVVVGAATVAAEGYGPPRGSSVRIGVVTASGRVDVDTELFRSGAGFLVMPEDGPEAPRGIDVVRAGRGRLDLALALGRLAEVVERPRFVLGEGGPRLNGSLLDAGCVDELDLSIAPVLAGGSGRRLIAGAAETLAGLDLAHVLADEDGYLFTRWVRSA